MIKKYGIKNKSSKQCRERWVNCLCPNINKGIWSEKEENILFSTQLKIGNKWSELTRLLPGRSENDIKNHFYSKLRKYIRKICKELHKSQILENNGINSSYYCSNKVYSLIQKENIPLLNLSKKTIINIIQKDYLIKQEKLLNLQENTYWNFKLDNYLNSNSISESSRNEHYFKKNNNQFNQLKKNSDLNDFDFKINNKEVDNDSQKIHLDEFNYFGMNVLNKKRKGINIFEELLKDN
jgi:hypothetical protein